MPRICERRVLEALAEQNRSEEGDYSVVPQPRKEARRLLFLEIGPILAKMVRELTKDTDPLVREALLKIPHKGKSKRVGPRIP